jgi:hypothetical protein
MSQVGQFLAAVVGGTVFSLTGNAGGVVGPVIATGNIDLVGAGAITVTGNPGGHVLTISVADASEIAKGVLFLAIDVEAIAGTNSTDAIVPTSLKAKLGVQTLHGLPYGMATTAAIAWTAEPTDGQVLIGHTGNIPQLGTISAGLGITVTNTPHAIDIAAVAATTILLGSVYLATNAETRTGTDTTKCVTPDDLNYKLGAQTLHGLPYANASTGSLQWTAEPTDGQILIGHTGNIPQLGTISAGTGITVTSAPHSITIAATFVGLTWSREAASPVTLVVNHGYVQANAGAGLTTFNLPATALLGETMEVIGESVGGWLIATGAGQTIQYGNLTAATSLASSNRYDTVTLKCRVAGANTVWHVTSATGVLNVV